MRVLHIRTSSFLGSPEKLILSQIKGLSSRIQSYVVVVPDQSSTDFENRLKDENVPVQSFSFPLFFPWIDLIRLLSFIRRKKFDVIVTHDYKANFFSWVASFFARFSHVAVFHGRTSHSAKSRLYETIDNWILKRVDQIVAVSKATKSIIPSPQEKIAVIHNAYSWAHEKTVYVDWKKKLGLKSNDTLVLTAGRLSEEKNYTGLIEAFGKIASRVPTAVLAIAGEGPEKQSLETLIQEKGLGKQIRLLGFVDDMSSLYNSMDLFVLSSKWEGLPLVLLEAAAHGKPCVSTNVGGIKEFLKDKETGYLVDPNKGEALAKKMLALIQDPKTRRAFGRKAKEQLEKNFSEEVYAQKYEDLYWTLTKETILWVTWESHRRTREISESLGIPLQEILYRGSRLFRYPSLTWKTLVCLMKRKPRVLVVQSPSIILASLVAFLKPFLGYQLVVDAHNEAVRPYIYQMNWYKNLIQFAQRKADLTIITNEGLKKDVEQNKGNAFVLPDRIPALPVKKNGKGKKNRQVVFICTYAPDEPYQEVVEAARQLEPHVRITITGNTKKADPKILKAAPSNVRFTGFLSDEDFVDLLNHSDAIMDLTAMDDCLVCGAYEAVAVEKPMITSDKSALKNYFRKGAVYAEHSPEALAKAVQRVFENHGQYQDEVRALKKDLIADWDKKKDNLLSLLVGGLN